ncbi:MAG: U32 family peptidase [Christensenellaceae bacterium]|nr:U32 family peptidase [Christensenellaceae bacterium]
MKKPEIISPVGDYASLRRAIMCGADAVYLGLQGYNARSGAENFDERTLKDASVLCKLYGKKLFVALNTLIKESDFDQIMSVIPIISNIDLDGIIVSDIGLIPLLCDLAPDIPIHISTQAGVHNKESAMFFQKLGADRAVLARETSLKDIEEIKKFVPRLGIEVFVHGALCVSFSGQCLMSFVQKSGSGNLGTCKQPCRQKYSLKVGNSSVKRGYCLSTSDLCLIDHLQDLEKAGASSFKIEGRMRRPEYAAQTTLSYKAVYENTSTPKQEYPLLRRIYNRGNFCAGYIYSDTLEIMSTNVQGHLGDRCGKVLKVFLKGGYNYAQVQSTHPIVRGDGFKILRGTEEIGGSDVHSVTEISKGIYQIPVSNAVCANDVLYLTTDKAQNDKLNAIIKRIEIGIGVTALKGSHLSIYMEYGKFNIGLESDYVVVPALDVPVTSELIISTISALGDTEFIAKHVLIDKDPDAFFPLSKLNDLKRRGIIALRKQLIDAAINMKRKNASTFPTEKYNKNTCGIRIIECESFESLTQADYSAMCIVYRPKTFSEPILTAFLAKLRAVSSSRVYLTPPRLLRLPDKKIYVDALKSINDSNYGLLADNYGVVELARHLKIPYIGGIGLNIYNTHAMDLLADADYILISPELTLEESKPLLKKGGIPFVSGYLPVMHLTHCPVYLVTGKNCSRCTYNGEPIRYTDALYTYPATRYKVSSCLFTLHNPIPVNSKSSYVLTERTHGYFYSKIPIDTEVVK